MEAVVDALAAEESGKAVPADAGALTALQYARFVDEVRSQPMWRTEADKCADYYDGNQLSADRLAELNRQKLGSLIANFVKPAIDTVLGIEAKNRTDWRVTADDDNWMEVAEALSAKLHEAERLARADRACSDAYASQLKAGLGWAGVTRNADPFKYPYRAESIHRREMFWDWSARDPLLDDARYVKRRRWYPREQAAMYMPKHAKLINAVGAGWSDGWLEQAREDVTLMNAFDQESRVSIMDWDWRNLDLARVCFTECWYPVFVRGHVIELPGGRTVALDRKNPLHATGVAQGMLKPRTAVYRKLRASMWMGPHKLEDVDVGGNKLPYVPFWGYREDLTGTPYGLIRTMLPLQDEINARRQRLMWLLNSKRVEIDADALDGRFNTFEDILEEINRPDSMIVRNSMRKNEDAIKVESDIALAAQQFDVLQEAKQAIQESAGIFNSMMGKTDGAKSGVAIDQLVEQGSNTLGEINDNYRFARNAVGERLLDLIRADLGGKEVKVMTDERESRRKSIFLNKPAVDAATGIKYRENDVSKAQIKVVLEDVPSTPSYRKQQMSMIGETIKGMPPELQAALVPFFLESTDLKDRKLMAKAIRKQLGMVDESGEELDPQVAALQQQLTQLQAAQDQMAQAYEEAVQEQSGKAQELAHTVQQLELAVKNKGGELELRKRELDLKAQDSERAAMKDAEELQLKKVATTTAAQKTQAELELKRDDQAFKHEDGERRFERDVTQDGITLRQQQDQRQDEREDKGHERVQQERQRGDEIEARGFEAAREDTVRKETVDHDDKRVEQERRRQAKQQKSKDDGTDRVLTAIDKLDKRLDALEAKSKKTPAKTDTKGAK